MENQPSIKPTSSRFVIAEKLCEEVTPKFRSKTGKEFKRSDLNTISVHAIANPDDYKDMIVRFRGTNYYNPRESGTSSIPTRSKNITKPHQSVPTILVSVSIRPSSVSSRTE